MNIDSTVMNPDHHHSQMPRFWAVVPAAGAGKRMNSAVAKQYLVIDGRTVLEHTLHRLAMTKHLAGIIVALSADDQTWPTLKNLPDIAMMTVTGGEERHESVFNALCHLIDQTDGDDWVLVHDAARPCVRSADIELLIDTVTEKNRGGLLGVPVSDTMKRVNQQGCVEQTISRDGLWHALTPQMFRLAELHAALGQALAENATVTDDAGAMERLGYQPVMVGGHADNIKITRSHDLRLAELYLAVQHAVESGGSEQHGR